MGIVSIIGGAGDERKRSPFSPRVAAFVVKVAARWPMGSYLMWLFML